MITTAVILARGLGTRMRAESDAALSGAQAAAASSGHKALMPIGEHRLIDYSLSALADAGITRVVLVVAPDHAEFREHIAQVAPERLHIDFAVQEEALGTAHAVASAADAVGADPFVMANGDNLYPVHAVRALRAVQGTAIVGFDREALIRQSNIPADRIAAFALIRQREDGRLQSILEKPSAADMERAGAHALVSMNLLAFTHEVFDVCRHLEPSPRGEYEIVDALGLLDNVEVIAHSGGVLDLSRREDIAEVEQRLADTEVRL